MKKYSFLILIVLLFCTSVSSQNMFWERTSIVINSESVSEKPVKQIAFKFNSTAFLTQLISAPQRFDNKNSNSFISLPNEFGVFESYKIFESSNFDPVLANKYPQIKSYIGIGTVSGASARMSYSPSQGLHVFITNLDRATTLIKPADVKNNIYTVFSRNDISEETSEFECSTMESITESTLFNNQNKSSSNADDEQLRLYRLAVSTTGEYSQYFLDGTEVNDTERKTKVLASINTALVRINGIFERDFSITMQLIANNDLVVFLDPNLDPYSGVTNAALQNELDNTIGDPNYDIGHLFAFEPFIYGDAGCVACACTPGAKGQAYTVHSAPDSDRFYIVASHEFGHQFGGYHVQSSWSCRSAVGLQEVEPGSGSTILSYAGICQASVQDNLDDYFNYVNIRDVAQWTINDSSCAVVIRLSNNAPTANAGANYTIPISTAFVLKGQGTDSNSNDVLSFCWEENDPENPVSGDAPLSTRILGPMFRSKLPASSPDRYMPQLSDVISGNLTPTWEVVPSVSRTMDFVLTVRDNALSGGQTASDEMTITVDARSGPFTVSSQATTENWDVGSNVAITWDVAQSNLPPINALHVDLFLSVDSGYTYPYTLLSNTLNDGTQTIIVPNIPVSTTQARVMVRAANNIFYALNTSDINIQASDFTMNFVDSSASICRNNDAVYNFTYDTFFGFNEATTFSVENLPAGVTASFNPATATTNATNVVLTISNTGGFPLGEYTIDVKGTALNIEKNTQLSLAVFDTNINSPSLTLPSNNATGINLTDLLTWQADSNASHFEIEIATDINFLNTIDSAIVPDNFYNTSSLDYNTTYFWRVRSINDCLTTVYSNSFEFLTYCIAPTNINVANILFDTAEISWTENGNSSNWEVEIIPSSTSPTGTGIFTAVNPYLATNLNSFTAYDVYVRSSCSSTNFSSWEGPVSFTTTENFCSGTNFYDTGGPNGNYSNNENYTTTIAPSAGFNRVSVQFTTFQVAINGDFLTVYDGPDISYPVLGSFNGNINPGSFTSSAVSGSLTFQFTSNGSSIFSGWNASVICENITCPEPSNIQVSNLSETTAELSWLAGSTETQWEIEYGPTGFTPSTGVVVPTTLNTNYPLTGLSSDTAYDVYIRANCGTNPGDDDSSWIGPVAFTTSASCPEPSNIQVSNLSETTADLSWLAGSTETQWEIEYGPTGFTPVTGVVAPTTLNTNYPLTGLSSDTAYDVYIRANCGTNPGDDDSSWTGPVPFTTSASCPEPSNIQVSNIIDTTVDLSWLAGSTETQWEIEYGPTGFTSGTGIVAPTTLNTNYPLSGLSSDTAYDVYIRANCGSNPGDDDSSWMGPISFSTIYNYCSGTNFYDTGGPSGNYSNGENYIKTIVPSAGFNRVTVQFNAFHLEACCDLLTIYDGPDTSSPVLGSFNGTINPGNFTSSDVSGTLTFQFTSNGSISRSGWDASVICENITCPKPSGIQATNIDTNSAAISWLAGNTETQWEIAYGFIGFTPGTGVSTPTNLNTNYPLTGLTPDTTYDVYVRANCGGLAGSDDSIWTGPIAFTTSLSCQEPSNLQVSNISETSSDLSWLAGSTETQWEVQLGLTGFTLGTGTVTQTTLPTNYPLTGLTSYTTYDVYIRANCGALPGDDPSRWVGPVRFITDANYCSGDNFYDTGGPNGNYANGSNYTKTIAPGVGFNSVTVQFDAFQLEACCDLLTVYDGPDTSSPVLGSFNGTINPGNFTSSDASGALTFRFTSDGSISLNGWKATVICENISCPDPSGIQVTTIDTTSVELSWLAGNTETQWEVEYGQTGFTQGTGVVTPTTLNTNSPLTGLTSYTAYDVYVRSNCGTNPGDDDSFWIGPISFTTLPSYCSGDNFYDTGGLNGNYSDGENYSTTIAPGAGFNRVTVQFNAFQLEVTGDFLTVYDGPDTSSPVLGSFNGTNNPGSFTSTDVSGSLTFRFTSDGRLTSSGWDATVICENITCPNPSGIQATTIDATSAAISWLAGSTETQWEVEYDITGFTQGTGVATSTPLNTNYPLTGLSPSTTYDVYVRANCGPQPGSSDSSWIGPISFTTFCGTVTAPFYEDFSSSTTPICWQELGSESWNFSTYAGFQAASAGDYTLAGGTNYAWIDGSPPNGAGQISNLRTMGIDVSQLNVPTLKFSVYSYNTNNAAYNTLNVIVHNDIGVNQNVLQLQGSTGGWVDYIIDLSTLTTNSSIIEIEFIIEENSPTDPFFNDILIDEVYVDSNNVLGSNEFDLEGFNFYPNPVNDLLHLSHTSVIHKIEVFTILGQNLFSSMPKKQEVEIDMSSFKTGPYFVRVEVEGLTKIIKIIKE